MSTQVMTPRAGEKTAPPPARGGGPRSLPYLLLLPATVLLAVVLGYPIVRLLVLSLQDAKLRDLVQGTEAWNNFANYAEILTDATFWAVMGRTIVFAAACVVATMVIGMMLALLLARLGRIVRLVLSVSLLMAWATPHVTATQVWQWLFDTRYGLVNFVLVKLGLTGFDNHSWLAEPASLLAVAGVTVVWGALPFVALTLYAGRTQIDESLYEAAGMDGATPWQVFRSITVPMLAPIITMLAALSTIWDFRVFTQVFLLQQAGGITSETNLISIHAYRTSFSGNDFGGGAAIAVVMVLVLAGLSVFAFILAWNEFILANVVLLSKENATLPLWLASFQSSFKEIDWSGLMAASTLFALPVIVFFVVVQGRLHEGAAAGGVKG